ncbi:hypothetical protein K7432_009169 [Basidiobolus ranarum]|uniref:Uncharacterized protein n=1 Tax=Basidiobolus ranarum TaxID=34480 RepID=A0ABR2VXH1_9FUNG
MAPSLKTCSLLLLLHGLVSTFGQESIMGENLESEDTHMDTTSFIFNETEEDILDKIEIPNLDNDAFAQETPVPALTREDLLSDLDTLNEQILGNEENAPESANQNNVNFLVREEVEEDGLEAPTPPLKDTPSQVKPQDGNRTNPHDKGRNVNSGANLPASIHFTSPHLGQLFTIPINMNISWYFVGLKAPLKKLTIEAVSLKDSVRIPVATNIPANLTNFSWKIPHETSEGIYRLFVFSDRGRNAAIIPGDFALYEGEMFELSRSSPNFPQQTFNIVSEAHQLSKLAVVIPFMLGPLLTWLQ